MRTTDKGRSLQVYYWVALCDITPSVEVLASEPRGQTEKIRIDAILDNRSNIFWSALTCFLAVLEAKIDTIVMSMLTMKLQPQTVSLA